MQGHVYHWKHGWIPLTHYAALIKAHGSHKGAAKYLSGSNGHHGTLSPGSVTHSPGPSVASSRTTISAPRVRSSGPTWQKISTAEALGPDTRTEQERRMHQVFNSVRGGARRPDIRERALSKVKQAYRNQDGHTILIEAALSKEKTQNLLDSIHAVTSKTHGDLQQPVTFHVPTGDRTFSSGRTLAYVRRGQRTVFISPKAAGGEEQPKGSDHFMPAHDSTTSLRYTLTHELGHIVDGAHNHVQKRHGGTSQHIGAPTPSENLFREYRGELSKYGATNPAEAYAEAYAQWHQGGPGTSAVADAYARLYGWSR